MYKIESRGEWPMYVVSVCFTPMSLRCDSEKINFREKFFFFPNNFTKLLIIKNSFRNTSVKLETKRLANDTRRCF